MNAALPNLIDAFAGLNVLVVGDAMLDCYLRGLTGRLCREAPVPIVEISERRDAPGGAANTAANVARLGAKATLLAVCGDDAEGARLRASLAQHGVSIEPLIAERARKTLTKTRVMAGAQMLARFDEGASERLNEETEQTLVERLHFLFPRMDAVIISDYGYGALSPRLIETLAKLQARAPLPLVADARNLSAYRDVGVTAVKPNYDELVKLLSGMECANTHARAEAVIAHGEKILDLTGARIAAVTLDTDGAVIIERDHPPYRTYTQPKHYCCATGAGDTFVSAFALSLAAGAGAPVAAELASAAAALVVSKDGTAACEADELREFVSGESKHIASLERLVSRVEAYRQQGQSIVFTNGCFDILHRGHITYLSRAKALGDVLIVGVNADASVRRLKPGRPINPLEDRIQVLAALSCIDHIIAFEEDTPSAIISAIRPDVYVKGGDYTRETLPEAPLVERLGGKVEILPFVEDRSTTNIIERIRRAFAAAGD